MSGEVSRRLRVAFGLLIVFDQDPFPRDPARTGFGWIHFPEVVICEHTLRPETQYRRTDLAVEDMPSLRYQKMRFFLTWYRGPQNFLSGVDRVLVLEYTEGQAHKQQGVFSICQRSGYASPRGHYAARHQRKGGFGNDRIDGKKSQYTTYKVETKNQHTR